MTETKTFDPKESALAQTKLCNDEKIPHFAPRDGRCYDCGQNIYKEIKHERGAYKWVTGISVESAGKSHITSCPHCSHSYCD
jgi:DNA-directed RNA polymerase subunit RPC12/RpoP